MRVKYPLVLALFVALGLIWWISTPASQDWRAHVYVPKETFESELVKNAANWNWIHDDGIWLPRESHMSTGEPAVLGYLDDALRDCTKKQFVVDVGANMGHVTLVAARKGCSVVAFELQLACLDFFRAAMRLNCEQPHLVRKPLSDAVGRHLKLRRETECNGMYSTKWDGDEEHYTSTLDAMFPGGDYIKLLKIDIEGHELHALFGATQLFRRRAIQHAIVEATWWHRFWDADQMRGAFERLASLVYDNGYRIRCLSSAITTFKLHEYPSRASFLGNYSEWTSGTFQMSDGSTEKIIQCNEFVIIKK